VLNTATALNVRFTAAERRLQLIAGEVLITTARDEEPIHRPFLVETRQGEAIALGTQFTVRQADGATLVAVFDGAVEIRPGLAPGAGRTLHAGQQASFTGSGVGAPTRADEATGTAWTRGTIVALSMRLDDFVRELGRYSATPLSCDPAVADLRISGSYPTGDIAAVLASVSAALSLEVHAITRLWGQPALRIAPASRPQSRS
jgi:transmembrane sensor